MYPKPWSHSLSEPFAPQGRADVARHVDSGDDFYANRRELVIDSHARCVALVATNVCCQRRNSKFAGKVDATDMCAHLRWVMLVRGFAWLCVGFGIFSYSFGSGSERVRVRALTRPFVVMKPSEPSEGDWHVLLPAWQNQAESVRKEPYVTILDHFAHPPTFGDSNLFGSSANFDPSPVRSSACKDHT